MPTDVYSQVGKPAADNAKTLTRDWDVRLKPLIDKMYVDDAAFWRITCSTPSGVPRWQNEPRVTVIGDAVHSVTPADSIGANTVMQDSAQPVKLLCEASGYDTGLNKHMNSR